jgi:hypothetical protein
MDPITFSLWMGMAVHNNNADDGMRDEPYAAVVQADAVYKRFSLSLDHKSIPQNRDNGETWIEFKYRIK